MSYAYRQRKKNLRRERKFYENLKREEIAANVDFHSEFKKLKISWWKRVINWFKARIKDWREIKDIETEYKRNQEFAEKFHQ